MNSQTQIVVVHGALGSAAQMEPVAAALHSLGTVHNIELPGHGQTPLAAGASFTIGAFVDSLRSAVVSLGLTAADTTSRPVVFGYSMGGYTALALDASSPGTFAGIATLGTRFAWSPALALRELSRLDPDILLEKIPKFASALDARHQVAGGWKGVLEHTGQLLTALGDKPLLTRETMAAIQSRVTIAVGESDDTVGIDEAREYAAFIPNANARVISATPHPIERVAPSDIVSIVADVMQR